QMAPNQTLKTSSDNGEQDALVQDIVPLAQSDGWQKDESDGTYRYYQNGQPTVGWLVTSISPEGSKAGLQRYWLGNDGVLAQQRLVSPDEKNGAWWAYAKPDGCIVRGTYQDGDVVYLADNDGRLPTKEGWIVSTAYGQGIQRYYVEPVDQSEACAAMIGPSTKGWAHYTLDTGYVLRGLHREGDVVYLADNDGRAPTHEGWYVTTAYTKGSLERYYLYQEDHGLCVAHVGPSSDGWAHYTLPAGYVLRGVHREGNTVYLADNDGRTPTKEGWVVTKKYGQGLQRYYVEPVGVFNVCAAVVGASTKGWPHYTRKEGYVLRGVKQLDGYIYLANNDGRLATPAASAQGTPSEGWLVSKAYAGSLQRYYLYAVSAGIYAAKPGASTDGWAHYTRPEGYVVRGAYLVGSDVYVANNNGRLPKRGGWMVTSEFGQGLQRYYFYEKQAGIFAARTGISSDGYLHYTTEQGYVMRNAMRCLNDGKWYKANNDGLLTETQPVSIVQSIRGSLCHGPKGPEYQRYIVLHDTEGGGNAWNIIDGWEDSGSYVASHFIINRGGGIVQCVPMDQIAHHAGFGDNGHNALYGISESTRDDRRGTQPIGSWASDYGMNAWSIGIELVHEGNQSYPAEQLAALDGLIAYIDAYYGFQSTIIDHKMWRSYNSDTSDAFAWYLSNYRRTRTHDGSQFY
ncbi:MAG: peptidoglycan recognition family protein, partial [Atopobiaceae bacterium]|nr:peptidoglycan recognition family protein [Atopobiaceae bacterium]